MTDITNIPNLSEILQRVGYNFGRDVEAFVAAKDADTRAYIDGKYTVLAQEDVRVNGVIANLLKIADAQPGTPEWDEGQNLYTLISNNYVGLLTRIEQSEADILTLQNFANQTTQDISTWMTNVNGRIDAEILRAKGEEQAIRGEIQTLKTALENKDGLTDQTIATMQGQITTLTSSMILRQNEILALQTKQTEYGNRLDMLESKFVGVDVPAAVNEFRRGLAAQPSAFGYGRVPVV
jgi:hypothetical protein